MASTTPNTARIKSKFVNEIRLTPDFDNEFSNVSPAPTQPQNGPYYSSIPRNGKDYYSSLMGSFFIDCSNLTSSGNGVWNNPARVQVPLIKDGFGLTANTQFTPENLGISSSVPQQQGYNVFDKSNKGRFMCNSVELRYTTLINRSTKDYNTSPTGIARLQPRHKTIVSTWMPFAMSDTYVPDGSSEEFLPETVENFHIFSNSTIHSSTDIVGATNIGTNYELAINDDQTNDPYLNLGGLNDPYGTLPTFNNDEDYLIVRGGILDIHTLDDGPYPKVSEYYNQQVGNGGYHSPQVKARSFIDYNTGDGIQRINFKAPTPVFEFFVVQPFTIVKGTYKIY